MSLPTHIPNLCAVTKELVQEVAESNKDLFIKNDVINTQAVLFHLGFYLDQHDYWKGVRTEENVLVRNRQDTTLVYYTTIYTGKVRRAVKAMNGKRIVYDLSKYHELKPLYEKYEVLQPTNIYKYIPKENMSLVTDIGDIAYYNKD